MVQGSKEEGCMAQGLNEEISGTQMLRDTLDEGLAPKNGCES